LLYRRHFRSVLGYALARLEPERAKDVAAETFLIAWRRLGDVPDDSLPWLFGVARKVVAGQVRTDARRDALRDRMAASNALPGLPSDPADVIAQRDMALAVLDRLPAMDREVLTLVAWDGLDGRQAAEALGISRLSFAVRLHRARKRLAAGLAAEDSGPTAEDSARATTANARAQVIQHPATARPASPTRPTRQPQAWEARR
jgi:RNA polymerase sigma factor (sigma-70 family)